MTIENLEDLLETYPRQVARTMEIGRSYKTLLHFAAERGEIDAMKSILKGRFIDINALGVLHSHENDETLTQMTPLMFALYSNKLEIAAKLEVAALLIEHGADLDLKNSKGENAFMILQRVSERSEILSQRENYVSLRGSDTDRLIEHRVSAAVHSKQAENLMNRYC